MKHVSFCLAMALVHSTLSGAEIIGHRGASAEAPENTVSSVRLGFAQAADAVEVDIYLSKDQRVVVLHDADTKRTTGVDLKVAESTLEQLQSLDAGSWKGTRWAGERVPALAEVLAAVPAGKQLFIEIKCGPEVLPALERDLNKAKLAPRQIVLIGFGYDTMKLAKERFPNLKVCWLSGFKQDAATGAWSPTIEELIARAKAAGVDGLDLSYKGLSEASSVRQIKEAGLDLYVYTVNDPEVARQLAQAGVDGVTTDRPGWLRQQLGQ